MSKHSQVYQDDIKEKPHFFVISQLISVDKKGKYNPSGTPKEIQLTEKPIYTYFETAKKIATTLCNVSANLITIRIQRLPPLAEKKYLSTATEEELTKFL
jgi:hypothetical protein